MMRARGSTLSGGGFSFAADQYTSRRGFPNDLMKRHRAIKTPVNWSRNGVIPLMPHNKTLPVSLVRFSVLAGKVERRDSIEVLTV
jgi:hypothetical protein